MTSATTSESLIVNVAVSTANGLPYRPIELFADPARAVADDALGMLAQDRQAGADAVRGVPHRRQARPVIGPAVHVLLVAPAQELEPAQLALVVQLLDEQVLAAVDDRLHHHVDLAALRWASTICRHSSIDVPIGTVQATCFPAFKASIDIQAWSGIGELMWTASMFGSFKSSR